MKNETNSFTVGETYSTRSACNHDCIFSFTVTKRTAKFVTLDDGHSIERRGVYLTDDGVEHCRPSGSYSMAPIIDAVGSLMIDGEIASEKRGREAREAREAAAPTPKPNPQLAGLGVIADPDAEAARAVGRLIAAGFTMGELAAMGIEGVLKQVEALYRRDSFRVV